MPLLALRTGEGHARGIARTLRLPEGRSPRAAFAAVGTIAALLGLAASQPVLALEHGGRVRTGRGGLRRARHEPVDAGGQLRRFAQRLSGRALALRLRSEARRRAGRSRLADRSRAAAPVPVYRLDLYTTTIERAMEVDNPPGPRLGRTCDNVRRVVGACDQQLLFDLGEVACGRAPYRWRDAPLLACGSRQRSWRAAAVVPVVVHVWARVNGYTWADSTHGYAADQASRQALTELAAGGVVLGEDDAAAVARATRAALGTGDRAAAGQKRTSIAWHPGSSSALPACFMLARRIL